MKLKMERNEDEMTVILIPENVTFIRLKGRKI
jgi:hypothetical protein